MSHLRKRPGRFYAYPEHRSWWRRLLWRLGFDPLTLRERLRQVETERDDYRQWLEENAGAVWSLFGDHRDEIQAEKVRLRAAGGFGMNAPTAPRYTIQETTR